MLAGLSTLQCVVDDERDHLLAVQLCENIARADLTPMEEAQAFQQLLDMKNWSRKELATYCGCSEAKISRSLALLQLPEPVQQQVESGELKPSAVREMSRKRKPREAKKQPPKEWTFKPTKGVSVTITSSKDPLSPEMIQDALERALEAARGQAKKAA